MLLVRAAGGLMWRDAPGAPRIAIVHRPRYRDWGLPKVVLYWRMALAEERPFEPDAEVDALAWHTREEALARLDHASERRLVALEPDRG